MDKVASRREEEALALRAATVAEFRSGERSSIIALIALAATSTAIGWAFSDIANPWALAAWGAWTAATLLTWAFGMAHARLHPPEDDVIADFTVPTGKLLLTLINLGVAAGLWVFLTNAGIERRLITYTVYFWYILTQALAATRATDITRSTVVLLVGSLLLFEITHPTRFTAAIVPIFVAIGATTLMLRQQIRSATMAAFTARNLAERRGEELEAALGRLAEERDARTRFIASASHDLQQPVQAARLFFGQAMQAPPGPPRERAERGATRAFDSVQRLLRQMLDHLRLEAGAMPVALAPVPLGPMIEMLADEFETSARDKGVVLHPVGSSLVATADPELLRRALANLIGNAIVHSGGKRIVIGVRRAGERVRIVVADDGRGIDQAFAPRLFDDYAQSGDTVGGFGIGLASARRIAEAMGGALDLVPGSGGAMFALTLKQADPIRAEATWKAA